MMRSGKFSSALLSLSFLEISRLAYWLVPALPCGTDPQFRSTGKFVARCSLLSRDDARERETYVELWPPFESGEV